MTVRAFQHQVVDILGEIEPLVQGGCKAIAEDSLEVISEVEAQLQTAAGVAVVVTTPEFKRNGCSAGAIPVDAVMAVKCIEQPATNRQQPGHLTALDAAERVAWELDGETFNFTGISQTADARSGTVTASANFNVCISLTPNEGN